MTSKITYKIKPEYAREDSLFYHISEVVITKNAGNKVEVYDIHDGNVFLIEKHKLELTEGGY